MITKKKVRINKNNKITKKNNKKRIITKKNNIIKKNITKKKNRKYTKNKRTIRKKTQKGGSNPVSQKVFAKAMESYKKAKARENAKLPTAIPPRQQAIPPRQQAKPPHYLGPLPSPPKVIPSSSRRQPQAPPDNPHRPTRHLGRASRPRDLRPNKKPILLGIKEHIENLIINETVRTCDGESIFGIESNDSYYIYKELYNNCETFYTGTYVENKKIELIDFLKNKNNSGSDNIMMLLLIIYRVLLTRNIEMDKKIKYESLKRAILTQFSTFENGLLDTLNPYIQDNNLIKNLKKLEIKLLGPDNKDIKDEKHTTYTYLLIIIFLIMFYNETPGKTRLPILWSGNTSKFLVNEYEETKYEHFYTLERNPLSSYMWKNFHKVLDPGKDYSFVEIDGECGYIKNLWMSLSSAFVLFARLKGFRQILINKEKAGTFLENKSIGFVDYHFLPLDNETQQGDTFEPFINGFFETVMFRSEWPTHKFCCEQLKKSHNIYVFFLLSDIFLEKTKTNLINEMEMEQPITTKPPAPAPASGRPRTVGNSRTTIPKINDLIKELKTNEINLILEKLRYWSGKILIKFNELKLQGVGYQGLIKYLTELLVDKKLYMEPNGNLKSKFIELKIFYYSWFNGIYSSDDFKKSYVVQLWETKLNQYINGKEKNPSYNYYDTEVNSNLDESNLVLEESDSAKTTAKAKAKTKISSLFYKYLIESENITHANIEEIFNNDIYAQLTDTQKIEYTTLQKNLITKLSNKSYNIYDISSMNETTTEPELNIYPILFPIDTETNDAFLIKYLFIGEQKIIRIYYKITIPHSYTVYILLEEIKYDNDRVMKQIEKQEIIELERLEQETLEQIKLNNFRLLFNHLINNSEQDYKKTIEHLNILISNINNSFSGNLKAQNLIAEINSEKLKIIRTKFHRTEL